MAFHLGCSKHLELFNFLGDRGTVKSEFLCLFVGAKGKKW